MSLASFHGSGQPVPLPDTIDNMTLNDRMNEVASELAVSQQMEVEQLHQMIQNVQYQLQEQTSQMCSREQDLRIKSGELAQYKGVIEFQAWQIQQLKIGKNGWKVSDLQAADAEFRRILENWEEALRQFKTEMSSQAKPQAQLLAPDFTFSGDCQIQNSGSIQHFASYEELADKVQSLQAENAVLKSENENFRQQAVEHETQLDEWISKAPNFARVLIHSQNDLQEKGELIGQEEVNEQEQQINAQVQCENEETLLLSEERVQNQKYEYNENIAENAEQIIQQNIIKCGANSEQHQSQADEQQIQNQINQTPEHYNHCINTIAEVSQEVTSSRGQPDVVMNLSVEHYVVSRKQTSEEIEKHQMQKDLIQSQIQALNEQQQKQQASPSNQESKREHDEIAGQLINYFMQDQLLSADDIRAIQLLNRQQLRILRDLQQQDFQLLTSYQQPRTYRRTSGRGQHYQNGSKQQSKQ